jgi:hypothetical protein
MSCEKEGETNDITANCEFPGILSSCFSPGNYENDEIVFRNKEQYQYYENIIRAHPANVNCDTAKLPEIDFEKFTLLGKETHGGGCGVKFEREVLKDTKNKKIIYKISVEYIGPCYMLFVSYNFVLVPKIPADYEIEFQVEKINTE